MEEKKMVLVDVSELGRIVRDAVRTEIKNALPQKDGADDMQGYFTEKELENFLRCGRNTIWRKERQGILHPRKIGSKKLYDKKEVQRLVEHGKLGKYVRV